VWSEKYRPKALEEMVGNEEGRAKLVAWLKRWKPGGKAALLVGPPGTGKTTTVHLVAEAMGLNLVELNASDVRTKDRLAKRIGEAISSTSLLGARSLVFLDEVDGLAGRADFGAIEFIKEAVKRSENPVAMAANDPESDEVRKLGAAVTKIEFRRAELVEVEKKLERVARLEGAKVTREELQELARAANGDLRAAVNFLQAGIPAQKDEALTASEAVNGFFDAIDERAALRALRSYPGQPREKLRDIFTAVVRSKVHEERRAGALDALSRADVIVGEIMRGRDWRLLRYLDPLLALDLWKALGDGGPRYTLDGAPWPLQVRIWNDSRKLKDIAALAAKRLGTSQKGFLVQDMPYLLLMARDEGFRRELLRSLGLGENYDQFLAKESARGARR
jgi:replication factor C large subunit